MMIRGVRIMKKRIYVMAAVLLCLTACSKNDIYIGSDTVSAETVKESETGSEPETVEETDEEILEEDEKTGKLPLNIEISAEYEGEWDENGALITADCSTIHILSDGYQALKTVLDEYNEKNWNEVYDIYLENREYAKLDDFQSGEKLFISREIEITRADQSVLSFTNTENSYLGGAHGDHSSSAAVFDTQTGEALSLSDVITDPEAVYTYVSEKLKEQYEPEVFFEDYEETLHRAFYEEENTELSWNMDMEGLRFTFNPYMLGPWASGTFSVKLPFESGLIKEEYRVRTEHPILRVNLNVPFVTDADGAGDGEENYVVSAMCEDNDENSYMTKLLIDACPDAEMEAPGEEAELTMKSQEFEFYGDLKYLYLVTAENGKKYLYAEFLSENDWHSMEVIDLSAILEERDAYVGKAGGATYGHFISDSDCFYLYERIYVLGTYAGYKTYFVGNDGMPEADSDMYEIVNRMTGREVGLTTKKSLKVRLHMSGSDEIVETVIRKGTLLYPMRTDGETIMELETEDGRVCDVLLERNELGGFDIDGVNENDCFESLPYAG